MWASSITFEEYPLETMLEILREIGFTGVEMNKSHLRRCRTASLREHFVKQAGNLGIRMGGLNVVGEPYFQPFGDEVQLEATVAGLRQDVDYALSLGVKDVLIWEGCAPTGTTEEYWMEHLLPRLLALFRMVLAYAEPKQVRILVEPHPFTVGMSDRLLTRLYDRLDSACFGITYDFCHYGVGRPTDYVEAVRRLGRRIRHVHFSDSDRKSSELHFAPGDGELDTKAVLQALRDIGYDGNITLDLYGHPTPVEAAKRSLSAVRAACEFLGLRDQGP